MFAVSDKQEKTIELQLPKPQVDKRNRFVTGNTVAKGRPKGTTKANAIAKLLDKHLNTKTELDKNGDPISGWDKLCEVLVLKAKQGNYKALELIFNYRFGKPAGLKELEMVPLMEQLIAKQQIK